MNTAWQARAACHHPSVTPTDFTPPRNDRNQPDLAAAARVADQICRSCPVRLDCLHLAMDINAEDMVMGGFYWPPNPYRNPAITPTDLLADTDEDSTKGVAA